MSVTKGRQAVVRCGRDTDPESGVKQPFKMLEHQVAFRTGAGPAQARLCRYRHLFSVTCKAAFEKFALLLEEWIGDHRERRIEHLK